MQILVNNRFQHYVEKGQMTIWINSYSYFLEKDKYFGATSFYLKNILKEIL